MRTIAEKAKVRRDPLLVLVVEEVEVELVDAGVGQVNVQALLVQAVQILVVAGEYPYLQKVHLLEVTDKQLASAAQRTFPEPWRVLVAVIQVLQT